MKTILICALFHFALITTCVAQQSITFRLVHQSNSKLAQDALEGQLTELDGYETVVKSNNSETNYYWIKRRPIISEEQIAHLEWITNDASGVTVTFMLTTPGIKRLAYATHNNINQQLAIFDGGTFMNIVPITYPDTEKRIVVHNIFNADEAEKLKYRIEKMAEHAPPAAHRRRWP